MRRRFWLPLLAVAAISGPAAAFAAASDPAAQTIETLDAALLKAMHGGASLGARGRFRQLAPVVDQSFDLPVMTAYAVGPAWAGLDGPDREALIRGFGRLTAASLAHNFDAYAGERFEIDPKVQTRGADRIVQSRIIPARGEPTSLTYRMRRSAAGWKIIDVYYGAISQLTTRRSDFAGPLAAGGAKGLVAHLDALAARLTS